MLDTIFIGMSGLTGYSKGLRVIGNNLTNVNTPGFKGAQLQFADLFYQQNEVGTGNAGDGRPLQLGTGLNTLATAISFKQGELRQTGNPLDIAIEGEGYFILRDDGESRYTRAGQFEFDKDGFLTSKNSGKRVAGLDASGQLAYVTLNGLQTNPARATSEVKFTGNLSSTALTDVVVNNVKVMDAVGSEHLLKLTFKNNSATTPGSWTVTATDGTATVGTGTLQFNNGAIVAGGDKFTLTYSPAAVNPLSVSFEFSANVTSFAAGNASTLTMASQDGYGAGALTAASFNAEGKLALSYSNGQTAEGMQLALARFDSNNVLVAEGGNEFTAGEILPAQISGAKSGPFGSISSGTVENANVDMAEEFSNLIIMQRGYQASSHVLNTANEMIQLLFDMKGRR